MIGVYFPENLTTSWATTPPKNAATGEILTLAYLLTLLNMGVLNSSMAHAPSVPLNSSLILSALSRQACASSSVLDGSLPLFWWNLKTPWRAIWRTHGLSANARSGVMKYWSGDDSHGLTKASLRELSLCFLGTLTSPTILWYMDQTLKCLISVWSWIHQ